MPNPSRRDNTVQWSPREFSHRKDNGREVFCDGDECFLQIDLAECCIRYGRLRPGGEVLIGGHGRSDGWRLWWGRSNDYKPVEVESFKIVSLQSPHIQISLAAVDEDGMCTRTDLKAGYSEALESYVYEFDQTLKVAADKPWFGAASGMYQGIEYCNFWPSGAFNHSSCGPVEQPDVEPHLKGYYGPELWQWMVYEEAPGKFCKVPLNRLTRTTAENMRPCDDGIFMLAAEEIGNPTLQFVGDTGGRTFLHLCHAIYDVHVNLSEIGRIAAGRDLNARYRLFDTAPNVASEILEQAETTREPVPWIERRFVLPRATIPGLNRFDEALDPYQPCDDYYWRPLHTGYGGMSFEYPRSGAQYRAQTSWDRQSNQLVMQSPFMTFLGWGLHGANYIAVKPGCRYRFSAVAELANVEGEGVCLAWSFFSDRVDAEGKVQPGVAPIESERITGTGSFQLKGETAEAIDCVIEHTGMPFHYNFLEFWIVLKGRGTVRISQVEISEI
ncbi:MAG: hypothetical protein QGF00_33155 [Planctomycetota bacterium]|nr:hypothetical protein [Planctomycetota bacterium]MDP7254491.1 hypothetical protein [Planctomycetota bacterium]